jgi:hypothetical protein
VFRVQRPAKLAFLKPEPGNLNPLGSFPLDDEGRRFMLPRFQPLVIALAGQHARLERSVLNDYSKFHV